MKQIKAWELIYLNEKLLERKLSALEQTIRKYTNNNFQRRAIRSDCFVPY